MQRKKSHPTKGTTVVTRKKKSALPGMEAALATLPIYGGTVEEGNEQSSETTETSSSQGKTEKPSSSSSESTDVVTDPQAVADLVKQVESLNSTVTTLTKENEKFINEKKQKDRESMGREEALSADLEDAQQTIVKMDQALRNQAVVNAINGFKDIEFYDTKFAMSKLSSDVYDQMEVDLENGTVTVSGIENDLRRIAKENEWAVKSKGSPGNANNSGSVTSSGPRSRQPARASGSAPNGAGGDSSKATTRKALAARFPVITHGRAI